MIEQLFKLLPDEAIIEIIISLIGKPNHPSAITNYRLHLLPLFKALPSLYARRLATTTLLHLTIISPIQTAIRDELLSHPTRVPDEIFTHVYNAATATLFPPTGP